MSGPSSPDPVSPYILLGMTATTGIVDAVSLLALGHVFTANMTGNVVFLGFALAGAPGFSIPRSSMALMAFLLGAAAGGRLATHMSSRPAPYWTSRAFCIDGLLLISAALASLTLRSPGDNNSIPLFGVIGLTALAMGFRNATTRKLGVPDLTTTVLTLTITGLAADSFLAGGTNPRWRRRIASVLLMFSGAAVGSLMVKRSVAEALCVCGIARSHAPSQYSDGFLVFVDVIHAASRRHPKAQRSRQSCTELNMKAMLISFAVGLLVGVAYALLRVKSPAPPLVALAGLLGMVWGEQLIERFLAHKSTDAHISSAQDAVRGTR